MPLTLHDNLKIQKNKLEQEDPWIYLVDIEYQTSTWAYYTNHAANITWNAHTYLPYPFAVGGVKASSSGEVQAVQVQMSNAGRFFTSYLKVSGGMIGLRGNLYKLSKKYLTGGPLDANLLVIPNRFRIVASSEEGEIITFVLSLGVDIYGIEGPIVDYDLINFPQLPYGPPRVGLGII